MELPNQFRKRLGYDNGISLILKATIGGRKALTRESLSQILKFQQNNENEAVLTQDSFLKFEYNKIITELCNDKHVYNKVTEKLMIYQRYSEEEDKYFVNQRFEQEIRNYSELVRCWNLFYHNSVEKSAKDFYEIVCSLLEDGLPSIYSKIESSNILNFYKDLEQILKLALNKLKGKMAVILVANPVSQNSKDSSSQDNFFIDFNSIIEEESQHKLSELSNISNIDNLSTNQDQKK